MQHYSSFEANCLIPLFQSHYYNNITMLYNNTHCRPRSSWVRVCKSVKFPWLVGFVIIPYHCLELHTFYSPLIIFLFIHCNFSSSLRPLPVTQTQTKAKKSAKIETTRKTRNSRRIQEQKSLPEDTDLGRNSNDDLLHLIDTMTFKPVPTEGD